MSAIQQLEAPMTLAVPAQRRHLRALPSVEQTVARSSSRVRLARRRFAVVLVLVVVAGGAFLAGKAFAADTASGPSTITVHEGDTLSALAAHAYPTMSVNQGVALLQQANNLPSSHVDAGEKLVVPQR